MTNNILFRYFGGPLHIHEGPSEHELREARRLFGSVDFTININNNLLVLKVCVINIGSKKRGDFISLKLNLVESDIFGLPSNLKAIYDPFYEIGTIERQR